MNAPDESQATTRPALARALVLAWMTSSALGSVVGLAYFGETLEGASPFVRAYAYSALVSSIATVFLVPTIGLALCGMSIPRRALVGHLQAIVFTLALIVLFVDTRVWGLFRYHLNGMVWNLITTPGGQDNFEIGTSAWVAVAAAGIASYFVLQRAWDRFLAPLDPRRSRRSTRAMRWSLAILLVLVVFEKATYAVADARGEREITARAAMFPLYQRLTMKRALAHVVDVKPRDATRVQVAGEGLLLRYPLEMPRVDPRGARPNILVIVIDSLRADMLRAETMPRVLEWSRGARVFTDHASGGNATRFGIFALVYGIHGSYWMPVYEERAPPVLVTTLQGLGYDLRVLSAARMTYPEFRSTAWVTIQDRVEDEFPEPRKCARDTAVAARFDAWLGERDAADERAPFFAFALLDSPHQTYDWPRERSPFTPYVDDVDYNQMASRPGAEVVAAVRNSYQNAVLHADGVAAEMIDALRRHGHADDTIVVVTGDHGEEFYEHGYFGHTSNFTREQVHVTFVLRGPGIQAGVEDRPTSHVDLAPTLLELLGADSSSRSRWSQGVSLLAPESTRERVIAGWQEVAVWVDGGVLFVPLEGHKGFVEARDLAWKVRDDSDAFVRGHARTIGELARACRTFLR